MPLLSEQNRRKRNVVIIASFLVLIGSAAAFDLGVFAPELPVASNIVIFALFNLNLIVFLLLLVLLFRNLAKVWFERKQNVIGARFRAKLVLAFLVLAVAPAALIFVIASNFINKSIEGWFKPQVERPLDQALSVAQTYYANLERTAIRHGQHMGRVIDRDNLLAEERREALAAFLVEQQDLLGISTVTVLNAGGQELVHVKDPILGDLPTRDRVLDVDELLAPGAKTVIALNPSRSCCSTRYAASASRRSSASRPSRSTTRPMCCPWRSAVRSRLP